MKIIFLDIDGVLNSYIFLANMPSDSFGIDKSRLSKLKRIIDETDARVVLSSSWRKNWDKNEKARTPLGKSLVKLFEDFGIEIFDKTPEIAYNERANEVKSFLKSIEYKVESFVILDDMSLGWGDLADYVVLTSDRVGYGLMDYHVEKAVKILNT